MSEKRTCKRRGCPKPAHARGWCSMHYKRWRKYGDPGEAEHRRSGRPVKANGPCSVERCDRPAKKRGWCAGCYKRWRVSGKPEAGPPPLPLSEPIDRFLAKVEWGPHFEGSRCLLWTGSGNPSGHGRFSVDGRMVMAYLWLYERWVGPIPEGHQLHHRCENPPCVNPVHLKPLTPAEHGREHRVTHCIHGHEYTAENTYRNPKTGSIRCLTCETERTARRRDARRAQSNS